MLHVFPAVFARHLVTNQRRRSGKRLVRKMENGKNGKTLEKLRFVISIDELCWSWNISFSNFLRVLKKVLGLFRDILVAVSCEVEMGRPSFVKAWEVIVCGKMIMLSTAFGGDHRDLMSIRDILIMYLWYISDHWRVCDGLASDGRKCAALSLARGRVREPWKSISEKITRLKSIPVV